MNEKTFRVSEAQRLDDPQRLVWMPPGEVVRLLGLRPGLQVADVGAGTGFFALPFARAVAPDGAVRAVDGQQGMVDILRGKLAIAGAPANVHCTLGDATATGLAPASSDAAFLGNLWHELERHHDVLAEMARILRPGGRLAIFDWRKDCPNPPGPPVEHRIAMSETERTLTAHGWAVQSTHMVGPFSYLLIATRPGAR